MVLLFIYLFFFCEKDNNVAWNISNLFELKCEKENPNLGQRLEKLQPI